MAVLAAGVVVAAVLTGVIDYRFELSLGVRRTLLAVGGLVLAWAAWRRLLQPLLTKLELLDVAALVDRATSGGRSGTLPADGRMNPGLQHSPTRLALPNNRGTVVAAAARVLDSSDESSPLIRKAIAQSDEQLERVPMKEALCGPHLARNLLGTTGVALVPLVLAFAMPTVSQVWASRWFGGSDDGYPRNTSIEVLGLDNGVLRVPRGEPARVSVQVTDKDSPTQVVWMRLEPSGSDRLTSTLDNYSGEDAAGDFRGDLPALAEDTPALVWGGDARAVRFILRPVDRPQVVGLDLEAQHPQEPAARSFDLMTDADVRLLKDTVATLTVRSTVPVKPTFETKAAIEVATVDDQTFRVTWTQTEPTVLRVSLSSLESGLESFPRSVPIGLLPDRAPSVTLRHSGVRLRVTNIASIPLAVTARDDFGLAKVIVNGDVVRLKLENEVVSAADEETAAKTDEQTPPEETRDKKQQTNGDDEQNAPADESDSPAVESQQPTANSSDDVAPGEPAGKPTKDPPKSTGDIVLFEQPGSTELRVDREHLLELTPLALSPGDVVKVAATAWDEAYGGAQERKSRTITFRVVKEDDLFREILLKLQQLRARLRKATDSADDLRTQLVTAAIPKDGNTLSRTFQVVRREVGAVTQQIKQTATEMKLNKLGGEQAEEMNELIERSVVNPLDRLLAGAMDRQRGVLGNLAKSSGSDVETNRSEAVERQQEIVDSLNEILKNMSQWDSFVDVVNQLNAVIKIEKTVRTKTDELRTGQSGEVLDPIGNAPKKDDGKPKVDAADDIFD